METEVKLSFKDRDSLNAFSAADEFRRLCVNADGSIPVLLENIYLDTASLTISGRGGMMRLRHYAAEGKDNYEITVKYGGSAANGLHKRYEWNIPSIDGSYSIDTIKDSVKNGDDPAEMLERVFDGLTDKDISVICSNSFYRTTYILLYGNSKIEACFDSGIIKGTEGRTDEICELELELIEGNLSDLNELAELIKTLSGGIPLEDTKYRRTLALALDLSKYEK